jgi:3-oxoacyl-(acyl-carrier-protein) synthase
MTADASTRVAVTGLGIISAIGESITEFKEGLFNGRCGIRPISLFDTKGFMTQSAAQVKNKNLKALFGSLDIRRLSRCDLLGLVAVREALSDSCLDFDNCDRNVLFWEVVPVGCSPGRNSGEPYGKKRPSQDLPCFFPPRPAP